MKENILVKVKNRVPVLFGLVTMIVYLVVLNLGAIAIVRLSGEGIRSDAYLLQFLATAVASIFLLLIVKGIGFGWIFTTKSRGALYNIGTAGYMLTVAGIAFASNMGTYLLTESHTFHKTQPLLQIITFVLAMAGVGFSEELAFRGILTNILREEFSVQTDRGIFLVLVVQGVIFGGCHIVNVLSGASVVGVVVQAIMASLLGIMLGAIYLRTNSLWFVAFLHGLNDFAALTASGIYGIDSITDTISGYSWINLAGAPMYILVIGILLRGSKRKEIKGEPVEELPLAVKVVKGVLLTGFSLFVIAVMFVSSFYATWVGMEI